MRRRILEGPPYTIIVDKDADGDGYVVIVPIVMDEYVTEIVSIVCNLGEIYTLGRGYWEFSFSIEVRYLDGRSEPVRLQERHTAARYITMDVKPYVMDVVCDGLSSLVARASAPLVYGVANEPRASEKVLQKYIRLTRRLEKEGYEVQDTGTDRLDRQFWVMGRKAGSGL
jgi:hypothetical protein